MSTFREETVAEPHTDCDPTRCASSRARPWRLCMLHRHQRTRAERGPCTTSTSRRGRSHPLACVGVFGHAPVPASQYLAGRVERRRHVCEDVQGGVQQGVGDRQHIFARKGVPTRLRETGRSWQEMTPSPRPGGGSPSCPNGRRGPRRNGGGGGCPASPCFGPLYRRPPSPSPPANQYTMGGGVYQSAPLPAPHGVSVPECAPR